MSLRFVLAPDSFKDSMTAKQVTNAMAAGITNVDPYARIDKVPMADGGEGTVDTLVDATHGKKINVTVDGPIPGQKVESFFGMLGDGKTAVIEMAKASGLELIPENRRNPMVTTTLGTGELIRAALDFGAQKIIIGIGGSATVDGGAGMAMALGVKFMDENGKVIIPNGSSIGRISDISVAGLDHRISETEFVVASDVTNPLVGKNGAAPVFGSQKGANSSQVVQLDDNLRSYAHVIYDKLGVDVTNIPGSGAAGGVGAGLLVFTKAKLRPGIEIVEEAVGLEEKIKQADCVFTGEGSIDSQTKFGKVPFGVAKLGKKHHKPVFVETAHIGDGIGDLYDAGISTVIDILSGVTPMAEALERGPENIERTTENMVRIIKASSKL
ncbi:glycerate kinase [Fructilactobacillus fructivorans]|uniref:glycerate kinase n=1 Tax=Fructilactobacillus fructivorans TaxID=1614 RepID=UPI000704AF3B|nr:glycerate kinase [Fructilactobacillus fructivorans]KRN13048.1 glycerate kinase [Fructilactobacillus fructivorans]